MNIRKQADYSELYRTLDRLMKLDLTDTELCYKIGQAICGRSEKGAAVVTAEYLRERSPDRTGCSPRNLRRMRDFYRAYENEHESAQLALQIGWTLNVIILEECNAAEERAWCLENTLRNNWKKTVLLGMIKEQAWLENSLDEQTDSCYTEKNNDVVSVNPALGANRINLLRPNSVKKTVTSPLPFPLLCPCKWRKTPERVYMNIQENNTLQRTDSSQVVLLKVHIYTPRHLFPAFNENWLMSLLLILNTAYKLAMF